MRERVEELVGPPARAAWVMTFQRPPAASCAARRSPSRQDGRHHRRLGRPASSRQALLEGSSRPKRSTPRDIHSQISTRRTSSSGLRSTRRVSELLRSDRRRRVRAVPEGLFASNARLRRHALSSCLQLRPKEFPRLVGRSVRCGSDRHSGTPHGLAETMGSSRGTDGANHQLGCPAFRMNRLTRKTGRGSPCYLEQKQSGSGLHFRQLNKGATC